MRHETTGQDQGRLAKNLALDTLPIIGHEIIFARRSHLWILSVVKKADRGLLALPRHECRGMGFDNDRIRVGAVPGPVNLVSWNTMEVSCFAMKAAILDEEPNLALEHVINLFGLMGVRRRRIAEG